MSGENKETKSMFSFFGKSEDPDLNIPVTGGGGNFMNYDPRLLQKIQSEDQYIMPEGAGARRGRFEKAFAQIGGACMIGGGSGGALGLYTSLKETKGLSSNVKRSQMLNIIGKQGASVAQKCGVVAVIYSIVGIAVSYIRGKDDEWNTGIAATTTGILYCAPKGLPNCVKGGLYGLVATAVLMLGPTAFHNK